MLTRLVPEGRREKVYGFQFMLMNAGLGVGGVVSALLVDIVQPGVAASGSTSLDALSYVAYIGVVLSLPRGTGALSREDTDEARSARSRAGGRCCGIGRCCGSCSPRWW